MQYLMDLYRTSSTEIIMLFVMLVSIIPLVFLIKELIILNQIKFIMRLLML